MGFKDQDEGFCTQCVKLATSLPATVLGGHLGKQLIRSSTSVAANYRACCIAQSKAAFTSKISIAYEECDESYFWIQFILEENLVDKSRIEPLLKEADELTRILASSRKTSKQ